MPPPNQKTITKLWLQVKIDGPDITVRQVNQDADGNIGYGEAIELSPSEKAQLDNVARSLMRKLEG